MRHPAGRSDEERDGTEQQSVKNGYAAGCNDYITKPINGGELLIKVRAHLGA